MKRKNEHRSHGYGDRIPRLTGKWLIMRLTITIGFMATAILSGFAERSAAQRVSIDRTDAPLETVFGDIRKQTGYSAVIPMALLRQAGPITLRADGAELREVLAELHERTGYTFTVPEGKKIIRVEAAPRVVAGSDARHSASGNGSLLILAFPEVRGKVIDSMGVALPGASVRVLNTGRKRTGLQTSIDRNGEFVLRNVPDDALLEISFIGYLTLEVPAASSVGMIVLSQAPSALQEVEVNAGYWKVKEKERTGNISRVTADEIEKQPVSNPLQALIGRMPGVQIIQNSGIPGGSFTVRVRGINSLRNDGNEPLYIVDGVPYNSTPVNTRGISSVLPGSISPFNSLSPSDIEAVEVLKDADATAIYGSRGANGVILITTKKARFGATNVSANLSHGISNMHNRLDLLNTPQYVEMRKEALNNSGFWPLPESLHSLVPDIFLWDTTRYTNWQNELLGGALNSRMHNYRYLEEAKVPNFCSREVI